MPSVRRVVETALAAACLVVCVTPVRAQTPALTFTRDDYASFTGARGLAAADFDRNGWIDLAQANTGRNTVTILSNGGASAPGFVRTADVAVGAGPFDLTTSDFNRDGVPDLAVANADGASVSILLGRTDGGFTRSDITVPAGPRAIVSADINKDGKADLAITGWNGGTVRVLYGNGAGGFTAGPALDGVTAHPQGLAAADFNRDGRLDLAIAHESAAGLTLATGTATGLSPSRVAGAGNLNVLTAADLNRDGWPDVAAASTSGSAVAVFLGGPSGLRFSRSYPVGASPRGIVTADVNADGVLDVITANRVANTVSVLPGRTAAPGTFAAAEDVAAGSGARALVAADFDRDGRIDVATGNQSAAGVTVLSNATVFERAAYSFSRLSFGTTSGEMGGYDQAWPADFNEDGQLDVLTQPSFLVSTNLIVLLTGGPVVQVPRSRFYAAFAVDDFNNDGHADVVTWQADPLVIDVSLGDGHGNFTPAPTTTLPLRLDGGPIADLNMDGRKDLVFSGADPATRTPIIQVLLGRGDGSFASGVRLTTSFYTTAPQVADVNRDGRPDVLASVSGQLVTWFGNGAGGLTPGWPPTPIGYPTVEGLQLADLDRDGWLEAVTVDYGGFRVFLGGAGGFAAPRIIPVPFYTSWRNFALADIDLDGDLDIAGAPGLVLRGRGDGSFDEIERFAYEGVGLHVADFTRDGLPDIVIATTNGAFEVIANRRNAVNHTPTVDAGPDRAVDYAAQFGEDPPYILPAAGDPDLHYLSYEWRDERGELVDPWGSAYLEITRLAHGPHRFTVTVRDGRGGTATDSVVVTITATKEIVLWAASAFQAGDWTEVNDASAAGGVRAYEPNAGAPKVETPSASPVNTVTLGFVADPTQTYKLWVRLKADGNQWSNDSVWVQFTGSTDASGHAMWQTGTTSALAVSLEECSGCGVSGWGWEDDGWGAPNRNGTLIRFPDGGFHSIVIQTREDGVSIDQVVLSSEKYLTTRPGAPKNDRTILPYTYWQEEG